MFFSSKKNNSKIKNKIELVSIHIPKTAGTSFRNILKNAYGEEEVIRFDISNHQEVTIEEKVLKSKKLSKKIKVIHGHFTYRNLTKTVALSDNVPIVTWLRDPIKRIVSNYYYLEEKIIEGLEDVKNGLGILSKLQKTLIEYARVDVNCNRMSKFLKGIELEELAFVGIQEYFDEDLLYLSQLLGLTNIESLKENVTNNPRRVFNEINKEVIDEIKELNIEDIELYEKGLSLRKKRVQSSSWNQL